METIDKEVILGVLGDREYFVRVPGAGISSRPATEHDVELQLYHLVSDAKKFAMKHGYTDQGDRLGTICWELSQV